MIEIFAAAAQLLTAFESIRGGRVAKLTRPNRDCGAYMNDQLLTRVQVEIEGLHEFLLVGFPVA
ncbi:MAG: hypothetical protein ACPHUF_10520, partial [Gammaproteobacteria bacterium]